MALLPTQKSTIKTQDPKNLIIFGLPKVGKTTALAQLDNALIVDMEDGTDYVEGYVVKARTVQDLGAIVNELKNTQHHYKFIVLDTVTALEEICLPYANSLYRQTIMGKNFDENENVLNLPNGAGYLYQRTAMQNIIKSFEMVAENVILVGHVKDKNLNEEGTELNIKTLDLSGKTGPILSAKSDAICYVFRDPETHSLMANFGNDDSVLCGARIPHLSGKTLLLAEKTDNGIITHWDSIFPSLKKANGNTQSK